MKKFLISLFLFILSTPIVLAENTFIDQEVWTHSKVEDAIKFVHSQGIVGGYSDNSFRPHLNISRGEFTKIMINTLYEKEKIENCAEIFYSDIGINNDFFQYICLASKENILHGYSDKSFKSNKFINVGEGAKIIANSFKLTDEDSISINPEEKFRPYIEALASINALPEDTFSIHDNLSRGQVVEIIYRIMQGIQDKSSVNYDQIKDYFLKVDFFSEPIESNSFDLIKKNSFDPDLSEGVRFFKSGIVKDTNIRLKQEQLNLSGYEYYTVIYPPDSINVCICSPCIYSYQSFIRNPENGQIYSFFNQDHYELQDGIIDISGKIIDPNQQFYLNNSVSNSNFTYYYGFILKSDNSHYYSMIRPQGKLFHKEGLIPVDSIEGKTIYIKENDGYGYSYFESEDGFLMAVKYIPEIVEFNSVFLGGIVTPYLYWDDGTQSKKIFYYSNLTQFCSESVLEIVDFKDEELKIVGHGRDPNILIYQPIKEKDKFLAHRYETLEYTPDDHLEFIYKDPFGRFIQFVDADQIEFHCCC